MSQQTNSELRRKAREALDGHWGKGVGITLLYFIITAILGVSFDLLPLGRISVAPGADISTLTFLIALLCLPLQWGFYVFFMRFLRDEPAPVGRLFDGYRQFGRVFLTILLQSVYTFLWSLLLIVPGIIKAFSYAMTPYVLRDHPELRCNGAIEESMRLMRGNKLKLFLLVLSFIGWAILCLLTLGFGFLLLAPYYRTSIAAFYEDLKLSDAMQKTSPEILESAVETPQGTILTEEIIERDE